MNNLDKLIIILKSLDLVTDNNFDYYVKGMYAQEWIIKIPSSEDISDVVHIITVVEYNDYRKRIITDCSKSFHYRTVREREIIKKKLEKKIKECKKLMFEVSTGLYFKNKIKNDKFKQIEKDFK